MIDIPDTLIFFSVMFLLSIIYIILILAGKISPRPHKIDLVVVVFFMLFTSVFFMDFVLWYASLTGVYSLPMSSGSMTDIQISERAGGESSFAINGVHVKVDNGYNDMLQQDSYCKVKYTPLTHSVIELTK